MFWRLLLQDLYRVRGNMFGPPHKVGLASHIRNGNFGEVCRSQAGGITGARHRAGGSRGGPARVVSAIPHPAGGLQPSVRGAMILLQRHTSGRGANTTTLSGAPSAARFWQPAKLRFPHRHLICPRPGARLPASRRASSHRPAVSSPPHLWCCGAVVCRDRRPLLPLSHGRLGADGDKRCHAHLTWHVPHHGPPGAIAVMPSLG
jgi:hypothetical protein